MLDHADFLANAISCSAESKSRVTSLAFPKFPIHLITSFPYTESKVSPTTRAVCQLKIDLVSCCHTGATALTSLFPAFNSALKFAYSFLTFAISSTNIGRLFDIARKKVFALTASEGSSRATCCTELPSPFHALA